MIFLPIKSPVESCCFLLFPLKLLKLQSGLDCLEFKLQSFFVLVLVALIFRWQVKCLGGAGDDPLARRGRRGELSSLFIFPSATRGTQKCFMGRAGRPLRCSTRLWNLSVAIIVCTELESNTFGFWRLPYDHHTASNDNRAVMSVGEEIRSSPKGHYQGKQE